MQTVVDNSWLRWCTWGCLLGVGSAAVFAGVRPFVPGQLPSLAGTYQAFAHIFVGFLIGHWVASKEKLSLYLAVFISLVELLMFLVKVVI